MGPREFHGEIPSTQDRAIELVRAGATEGTRVVACRQTAGRGRLDHLWASPEGGLYLSIVLAVPSDHPTLLPLALGARLAQELGDRYSVPLLVKWPNDVVVSAPRQPPKKLAGVLVDRVSSPSAGALAVAGIGVNVANRSGGWPVEVRDQATSLGELLRTPPPLDEVEEVVVGAAMGASTGLQDRGGLDATRALCRRRLYGSATTRAWTGAPSGSSQA